MTDHGQDGQLMLLIASLAALMFMLSSALLFRLYQGLRRERDIHSEHMGLVFDNTAEGIVLLRHGQILRINQSGAMLLGQDSETLAGKSLTELLEAADSVSIEALQGHHNHQFNELKCRHGNGRLILLEGTLSPIRTERRHKQHSPTGVLIFRDVSDRLQQQAQEARNHLVLAAVSRVNNNFLLYKDPKRRFGELLETLKELTGSPMGFISERMEQDGKPFMRCYAITNLAWDQSSHNLYVNNIEKGIDFHNLDNLFGRTLLTGEVVISNHHDPVHRAGSCPAGHPDLDSFVGIPLKFRGEVLGMYGLANRADAYDQELVEWLRPLTDAITGIMYAFRIERAQRESERRMLQARDEAEHANRLKSDFLATMSHEIRTPLNAVVGMLDSLEATELDDRQTGYVQSASIAADTLLRLINDVLDFSKIEAGMLTLVQEPFNLCESIHSVLTATSVNAAAKGLDLYLNYAPDVPLSIIGDPIRMRQILNNLVSNAVKFTEAGHIILTVSQRTVEATGEVHLLISIEDTGIGIDNRDLTIIFEAFRQIDHSITRHYQGTGLGLAITRNLVNAMQGRIDVKSSPGTGSRFIVELPLQPANTATLHTQLAELNALSQQQLLCVTNSHQLFEYLYSLLSPHFEQFDCHFRPLEEEPQAGQYSMLLVDDRRFKLAPESLRGWIQQRGGNGELIGLSQRDLAQAFIPVTAQLQPPLSPLQLVDTLSRIVQPETATATSDTAFAEPEHTAEPITDGLSILIAEDHPINQKMMEILMQRAGATWQLCSDGLEVIQAMQSDAHFDLILMDLHMPNMDGYEATRSIRDLPGPERNIPIIAVTADALAGDREKCLAAGMNDYLAKPVRLADLQQVIARTMAVHTDTATANRPEPEAPETFDSDNLVEQVGDAESAALLVREFANTLRAELQILQQALDADDLEAARSASHRIKGSARTIGCNLLAAQLQQIETACRSENKPSASKAMTDVTKQLPDLLEQLNSFSEANTLL
ncbi:MAG: ATP-binding protein [Marinobacterium sp.]